IQRRLDHPGIVRVSGVVQNIVIPNNPGSHYALVMEYVVGQDLGAYLQRKQRLSVAETLRISVQICRALDYAHSRKTIHRDIKPQNILIGADGIAKIIDFGFASVMSDSINSISGLVGTPFYISPEQAAGEKGDQKSDIYSVGVMMYEMLCGTVPFQGGHPSVVIDLHSTGVPKRLSERVSNIPPQLDDFVHKALEKKPNDRFHSAGEMVSVLERIARELGIKLDTSSWKERASNFWYKTIDIIVSNTIWWVFSVATAFMFAVMVYKPATLRDFSQLLSLIVAPPGPPEIAAQATLAISPLPTHTTSVFIAGSTETPTFLPTSTRKPKPTATQT
ncbi:serine/threonine protein kinase, partial [Candidatus Dojkabacteria bacterium]|nr:serine/threonine protein kinase [Candidatus Dojkabacteria bacterium]